MVRDLIVERQRLALTHPCARATDTQDDRFLAFMKRGPSTWSTILTVNK